MTVHPPDVIDLITEQVERSPDAAAVVEGICELTYAELAAEVELVAADLVARGVRPRDLVALVLPRGIRAVVAILAVLRTGAGYVPVEVNGPAARIRAVLGEVNARLFIVDAGTRDLLDGAVGTLDLAGVVGSAGPMPGIGDANRAEAGGATVLAERPAPPATADPDAPAYVIYTSGSAGQPKGVVVPRRAVAFFCAAARGPYTTTAGDRVLQFASLGFDASVEEILLPLSVGATVVIRDEQMLSRPDLFLRRCGEWGITVLTPPPAYWREILGVLERGEATLPPSVRQIVLGGEAVYADAVHRWRRTVGPHVRLINCYGPTETTVVALVADLTHYEGDGPVPIGEPLPGVLTEIRPVPGESGDRSECATGELWIGGPGVTDGYFGRPDLTEERFRTEHGPAGEPVRWYRTGDVVSRGADGRFAYLRRLDRQVQVRGVRVEISEVEAALRLVPGVADAVVDAVRDADTVRLEAHLIADGDRAPGEAAVRADLSGRLPAAMVPARIRFHRRFPRTDHDKIDLAALRRAPETTALDTDDADPAAAMSALWSQVLGRPAIGRDDDLFAAGADSLAAVRILTRLRTEHGVELTLADLFAAGTPARTADLVAASARVVPDESPRAATGTFELGGLQPDYWLTDVIEPGLPRYLLGLRYHVDRSIEPTELAALLAALVRRHPVLGARFPERDGRPVMVVDGTGRIQIGGPEVDLREGPVARAVHDPRTGLLTLFVHHIVFDGWSAGVVARDLGLLIDGATLEPPARGVTVPAYADSTARTSDRAYWRQRLDGVGPAVEVPADRPRPQEPTFAALRVERRLDATTVGRWDALGRDRRASLFAVVLTGVHALLSRWTGRTDPVVLAPVANRGGTDLEDEVGALLNTLPLRADTGGDPSFGELLDRVVGDTVADLDHQRLPLAEILAVTERPVTPGAGNPFSSVLLTVLNTPHGYDGPVRYVGDVVPAAQTVDLAFALDTTSEGHVLTLAARSELFDRDRVDGILDQLTVLLDAAVAEPGTPLHRLPLLSPDARTRLLDAVNGRASGRAPRFPLVQHYLQAVAAERPHAPALTVGDTTIDYAQLASRANRLAHHLHHRAGRPSGGGDAPIAIALPRGVDLFVAVWGALTAGRAYVALDLDHPAGRLAKVLADSGADVLVTRADTAGPALVTSGAAIETVLLDREAAAIAAHPSDPPDVAITPADPAYLVYTSGSTGAPKAAVVTHDGLTHAVEMWIQHYAPAPDWTFAQVAPVSFDLFVGETVRAHTAGGRLVVVPKETALDPPAFGEFLRRERVACTELVPSMLNPLLAVCGPLPDLRLLIGGGEAWPVEDYQRAYALLDAGTRIVNSYGVAEATVDSLCFEGPLEAGATLVPIGRPFPHQRAYVLDAHDELVPPGVPGELHLGGAGVAAGYHRRPGLTRQRFGPDPFVPGGRRYRTGDRARVRTDGTVEYLGRLDDQVKVRGHRIELGEVEAALRALPDVAAAAATLQGADLVGYVVADDGRTGLPEPDLLAALQTRLPTGAVPARVVVLPRLPRTHNGKLDRAALPAPGAAGPATPAMAPATATEQRIASVWAELLGIEVAVVTADSTFTGLGGDSFATVRMARAVSSSLRLVDVFRRPSLRQLARHVDNLETDDSAAPDRLPATVPADGADRTVTDAADRLLQPIGTGRADLALGGATIVGFPYAGGTSMTFGPLAEALPAGWALLAVELPGHDQARDEPLAGLDEIAGRVVEELMAVEGPVLLYGQCVGTALALEVARRVTGGPIDLIGLGLGAQFPIARLPGRFFDRVRRLLPTDGLIGNRAYLDYLRARGGFADVEEGQDADFVLRNVRHDSREAEEYFTAVTGDVAAPALAVPVLSVVGQRDRVTELYDERHREWAAYSAHVELAVIERGGHFFVKHQAAELADVLVDAANRWRESPAAPDPVAPAPANVGVRPGLRRFAVVAAGQTVSAVGSGIASLVIAVWALGATNDLTLFGLLSAVGMLPGVLVTPIAGAVADRVDRRLVMITANGVSMVATAGLALLVTLGGGLRIPFAVVALCLTSVAGAFQRPAYLAAVPQLVPKRYLGHAAGVGQIAVNISQVAGPLLGVGLLVALGIGGVLLLEAAGFAIGLLTLLLVRIPDRAFKRREESLWAEIAHGWRYVIRRAPLRAGLWFMVVDVAIYTVGFTVVTPLILARHSPVVLGAVLAVGGIGGVLGAVVMGLWGGTRRRTEGMLVAGGAGGLGLLIVGITGDPVLAAAGMFVLLFTESIIDGSWIAVLGTKVDPQLLGRVMAIFTALPLITIPLGFLIVLPVADAVVVPALADPTSSPWLPVALFGDGPARGLALLVVLSGLGLTAWAGRGWLQRALRHAEDDLPDAVPGPEIHDRDTVAQRADAQLRR